MPITSNPTDSFIVTVKMKSKGVIIVKNVFSDFFTPFLKLINGKVEICPSNALSIIIKVIVY